MKDAGARTELALGYVFVEPRGARGLSHMASERSTPSSFEQASASNNARPERPVPQPQSRAFRAFAPRTLSATSSGAWLR